jgi:cell division protein FtsB
MARSRSTISHRKELYFVISIVLAVSSAAFSLLGPGGYLEMRKARAILETHKLQAETLEQENSARMQSIKALRSDKKALESYAREKGYGRAGEIVQQLAPEPAPPDKKAGGQKP